MGSREKPARKGLYLLSPPPTRDQEHERRSGRGRDLVETPENIRRGRREEGKGGGAGKGATNCTQCGQVDIL